ncbi:MAG: hypothetical protein WCD18_01510 [Thermosynechococcaceae cyanobacterium]
MPKVLRQYIQQWCQEHGWTDLFYEQSQFWAFPPGSVLPLPVPSDAIEAFYTHRELSWPFRLISTASIGVALGAMLLTVSTLSPIPLLTAFGLCAIAVATLEEESC